MASFTLALRYEIELQSVIVCPGGRRRGVTQSNHMPSVTAYFEPRYNINKDLQLYVGTSTESISFANRAAA